MTESRKSDLNFGTHCNLKFRRPHYQEILAAKTRLKFQCGDGFQGEIRWMVRGQTMKNCKSDTK